MVGEARRCSGTDWGQAARSTERVLMAWPHAGGARLATGGCRNGDRIAGKKPDCTARPASFLLHLVRCCHRTYTHQGTNTTS